jgi:protein-serine/threonine kinase
VQVEVGPSSFLKIKLLGKGDVGRVYLVREKKSSKLFAMKGNVTTCSLFVQVS